MDRLGKVANPAGGHLNQGKPIFLSPRKKMYALIVITYRLGINRYGGQSCSWSAEHGKRIYCIPAVIPSTCPLHTDSGF